MNRRQLIFIQGAAVNNQRIGRLAFRQPAPFTCTNNDTTGFQCHP